MSSSAVMIGTRQIFVLAIVCESLKPLRAISAWEVSGGGTLSARIRSGSRPKLPASCEMRKSDGPSAIGFFFSVLIEIVVLFS